jgi:hypothetical protein
LTGTDRGATFDAAMKTVPPVPRPGCAGESLRVLAEESEMAKAIESVLFEAPKPKPKQPKKRTSSEGRPALCL